MGSSFFVTYYTLKKILKSLIFSLFFLKKIFPSMLHWNIQEVRGSFSEPREPCGICSSSAGLRCSHGRHLSRGQAWRPAWFTDAVGPVSSSGSSGPEGSGAFPSPGSCHRDVVMFCAFVSVLPVAGGL